MADDLISVKCPHCQRDVVLSLEPLGTVFQADQASLRYIASGTHLCDDQAVAVARVLLDKSAKVDAK